MRPIVWNAKIKGFCHLYIGQEACSSGSKSALIEGDKYITAYRDHGIPLALGTSPNVIMAELYGKITGASKGKGGSMHIFDKSVGFVGGHGIVGAQIPLGAGLALQKNTRKQEIYPFVILGMERYVKAHCTRHLTWPCYGSCL